MTAGIIAVVIGIMSLVLEGNGKGGPTLIILGIFLILAAPYFTNPV